MCLKIEVGVFQTWLKQRRITISFLTSSWVWYLTSLKQGEKMKSVYDKIFIPLAQREKSSLLMSVP